jgi:hypothetical protein
MCVHAPWTRMYTNHQFVGTRESTVRVHAYPLTVYMRVHDGWIRVDTVTCICRVHTYPCYTNTREYGYVHVLRPFVSTQHEYVWTRIYTKQCP